MLAKVLDDHLQRILPSDGQPWVTQAHEAMWIARINFGIACEQTKRRQIKASSDLLRLRVSCHNNCLET